jgi:dTDP-4-amino-4,6-dideoxygalactose transaminase
MIQVTKTYMPPLEDYIGYLKRIWESGQVTNMGALSTELEVKLAEYLDVPHIQYVANGTLALQLAIKALDITGEIITTPFSYVATSNAIAWENCKPVFVDIERNSFCIDPDQIEAAITDKTQAILATHVYGYPCDVEKIAKIAKRNGLKVIYDAAHCFGVRLNGTSLLN